jgi:hypothetical protein
VRLDPYHTGVATLNIATRTNVRHGRALTGVQMLQMPRCFGAVERATGQKADMASMLLLLDRHWAARAIEADAIRHRLEVA